ncbi:MAG TPA: DNA translocase FtsK, partial [Candidatus Dormibacteraeota bacterium]
MGVVLLAFGLLVLVAMMLPTGTMLAGLHSGITGAFDAGWPVIVLVLLAAGVYQLWPAPPPLRLLDVGAGVLAVLAALGLLGLALGAGGGTGGAVAALLVGLAGGPGASILLIAALLLGLIVAFRFSPGSALAAMAGGMRAAYAERSRIEKLVRTTTPAEPTRPAPAPAVSSAVPTRPAPAAAAVPAAVGVVEPPAWLAALDEDDDAGEPEAQVATATSEPPPVMRVVAEPEDEEPEVDWKLPPVSLLDSVSVRKERMQDEIKRNVRIIEHTLNTFGVTAKVVGVNPGPAVTQYELQPAEGVQVKRITALHNDLSLALAASPIRIEAPIPGKSAVGIEVPNKSAALVSLREVVESAGFRTPSRSLAIAVGNDVSGQPIVGDLTRMPHLLIAGATGQGKSVCINVLISSLLFQCTPSQLRLVLIDPKRVELSMFNRLPHLAVPVIVESHQAASALRWAVAEMDRRYKLLSAEGVRNIVGYNEKARAQAARELPYVVIVIDELADLMMVSAGEIEELVCRIAQLARAVGIHLVIATQRPSTDIITGLIKANIPSRIAFAVGSQVD